MGFSDWFGAYGPTDAAVQTAWDAVPKRVTPFGPRYDEQQAPALDRKMLENALAMNAQMPGMPVQMMNQKQPTLTVWDAQRQAPVDIPDPGTGLVGQTEYAGAGTAPRTAPLHAAIQSQGGVWPDGGKYQTIPVGPDTTRVGDPMLGAINAGLGAAAPGGTGMPIMGTALARTLQGDQRGSTIMNPQGGVGAQAASNGPMFDRFGQLQAPQNETREEAIARMSDPRSWYGPDPTGRSEVGQMNLPGYEHFMHTINAGKAVAGELTKNEAVRMRTMAELYDAKLARGQQPTQEETSALHQALGIAEPPPLQQRSPLDIMRSQDTLDQFAKAAAVPALEGIGNAVLGASPAVEADRLGQIAKVVRNAPPEAQADLAAQFENYLGNNPTARKVLLQNEQSAQGAALLKLLRERAIKQQAR